MILSSEKNCKCMALAKKKSQKEYVHMEQCNFFSSNSNVHFMSQVLSES